VLAAVVVVSVGLLGGCDGGGAGHAAEESLGAYAGTHLKEFAEQSEEAINHARDE